MTATITLPAIGQRETYAVSRGVPPKEYEGVELSIAAGETTAWLPIGWKPVSNMVYHGTTGSDLSLKVPSGYAVVSDGYHYGVEFTAAPGAGVVVVLAVRGASA